MTKEMVLDAVKDIMRYSFMFQDMSHSSIERKKNDKFRGGIFMDANAQAADFSGMAVGYESAAGILWQTAVKYGIMEQEDPDLQKAITEVLNEMRRKHGTEEIK